MLITLKAAMLAVFLKPITFVGLQLCGDIRRNFNELHFTAILATYSRKLYLLTLPIVINFHKQHVYNAACVKYECLLVNLIILSA